MTQAAAGKVEPSSGAKPKRYAAKGLLLVVALSISLACLEFGVRWLFPFFNPSAQIPFQLTTNGVPLGPPLQTIRVATPKGDFDSFIRFSADGFRDSKHLREANAEDWFALGDSFTMGWGVEEPERFSNRLEQQFAANGSHLRVFNIAIPENIIGYQRLLRYAESRGANVRHLIVGVCMENDLLDYRDGKSAWDSEQQPTAAPPNNRSFRRWLKDHSALYIGASFALQKIPFLRRLLERSGIARNINELSGNNQWNETILKSSCDELVKLVSGRDALVLIIPARHLWHGNNQETERRVHESFVRILREAGLSVLDLKGALESEGDPLSCYFKTDPHWNPHGHAVAARELFLALKARAPN